MRAMDRDEVLIVSLTDGLQRDQPFLMNAHQRLHQLELFTNEPCGERDQPTGYSPANSFYKPMRRLPLTDKGDGKRSVRKQNREIVLRLSFPLNWIQQVYNFIWQRTFYVTQIRK